MPGGGFPLVRWGSWLAIGSIAWYTWNVARVAWRSGNRSGAAIVGALALTALLFPAAMLLR